MAKVIRKGGNISIVGIHTGNIPIYEIMKKSITIRGGKCPVQKYWKYCLQKIESGELDPTFIITDKGTLSDGPKFYEKMNNKEDGCIKVFIRPESNASENILQDFSRN
uniref:Uncharacterized protein n=1 Tax=Panagrolaimus sp. ES5 TaxID=591445 RepID=A0AC34F668_9BILA